MKTRRVIKFALPVLVASSLAHPAFSQVVDSARSRTEVTGAMSVTNKGIGTIPTSTLGKPAASLDVSIRRGGFSFASRNSSHDARVEVWRRGTLDSPEATAGLTAALHRSAPEEQDDDPCTPSRLRCECPGVRQRNSAARSRAGLG